MQFDNLYLTHHRFPKRGTLFLYANYISLQQSDLCELDKVYHINMNIYHGTFSYYLLNDTFFGNHPYNVYKKGDYNRFVRVIQSELQ